MDCQFCHFLGRAFCRCGNSPSLDVRGLPPGGAGDDARAAAEIAKIQEYADHNEPIPWNRIYKISDHAHFPHMRHVDRGLWSARQCHGEVQTYGVLNERDPAWGGDNMGWCIDCHRNPPEGLTATDGSPIEEASIDCAVCHY